MAQYELLIHAHRAVVDGVIQKAAVTVDGGVISSVRTGSDARDIGLAGEHTIDLGGDVVLMPGLVDPHVCSEDVGVATRSAARGGVTTVVDYGSDVRPAATDAAQALRLIMALADEANKYIDERKPWVIAKREGAEAELQGVCTQGLNLFRVLALALAPVLPATASRMARGKCPRSVAVEMLTLPPQRR